MPDADPAALHLVTVWNPAYAADAMGAHLAVLLDAARRVDAGALDADRLHVWWGKVRSSNRQQPYPHLDDVRAVARALDADARDEVHLYLTDYRSLYVGDVTAIVTLDRRVRCGSSTPSCSTSVPSPSASSSVKATWPPWTTATGWTSSSCPPSRTTTRRPPDR